MPLSLPSSGRTRPQCRALPGTRNKKKLRKGSQRPLLKCRGFRAWQMAATRKHSVWVSVCMRLIIHNHFLQFSHCQAHIVGVCRELSHYMYTANAHISAHCTIHYQIANDGCRHVTYMFGIRRGGRGTACQLPSPGRSHRIVRSDLMASASAPAPRANCPLAFRRKQRIHLYPQSLYLIIRIATPYDIVGLPPTPGNASHALHIKPYARKLKH